jgi:hypothetical protein
VLRGDVAGGDTRAGWGDPEAVAVWGREEEEEEEKTEEEKASTDYTDYRITQIRREKDRERAKKESCLSRFPISRVPHSSRSAEQRVDADA